ncbi:flagellar hook-basal body complex protein [Planococcus halocryophilus]|uniref:flagellar hook-basal body complex protein n=1 Tax=Planococcus halocryophilus TaxID=1215089 RepID=UPI001F10269D|nr:flagellar hook-basal body complex protein [Planococcus halocryophilus]MCH4827638.1 flagellar hook-basal body complex protein [Planococcus halocryophilus]
MLRSMYSGVSGMKNFQTKLDVIGNNIANVNTNGYKKSTVNFQDLISQNMSNSGTNPMQVGLGTTTSAINVNHNPGSVMSTGIGTDLAIMEKGFFVVQDPEAVGTTNDQFLTRSGSFSVTTAGNLVTAQGYNVLGKTADVNGQPTTVTAPINVSTYDSFRINRSGEVIGRQANGDETTIAFVGISNPENPEGLKKIGGSMYEMPAQVPPIDPIGTAADANTEIGSGMLEMSNVDLTEEFTEMIIAQRGFQANSRTITTSDEILQEVMNLKR